MTKDQAIPVGEAFCNAHLAVIEAAYGVDCAVAYAAGMASAARNLVLSKYGTEAAHDLCFQMAEDVLTWDFERRGARACLPPIKSVPAHQTQISAQQKSREISTKSF